MRPSQHRMQTWLPLAAFFIRNPAVALVIALLTSPILLLFSVHWAIAPFCFAAFLVALHVDWELCDRIALPPLGLLLFMPAAGATLGVPLYVQSFQVDYIPVCMTLQVVFIVTALIVALGYRLGRGKFPQQWCPPDTESIYAQIKTPLLLSAWALCAFDLVRVIIGWRTGSLDRGFAGEVTLEQSLGLWTIAGIFGRFNNLWFFLLPFMWRNSGGLARIAISAILSLYAIIAFASGSRGLMLYPVIIGAIGFFFFTDRARFQPQKWLPAFVIFAALYVYLVDVYRNTDAFSNSRLADLTDRLAAAQHITTAAKDRGDFAFTTGRALIGTSDDVVFEATPSDVPFAGVADILPAVLWTWVPHVLAPDKPPLWDSNEIVVSYTNIRQERSFASISLGADLFRRLGWPGFLIGMFLFAIFFGLFTRFVLNAFCHWNAHLGILLIAFLVAGVQSGFSSSVLQTWWIWAYDMPKHLVALFLLHFFLGGRKRGGTSLVPGRSR